MGKCSKTWEKHSRTLWNSALGLPLEPLGRPSWSQDSPKWPPDASKILQDAPKTRPRRNLEAPKPAQNAPSLPQTAPNPPKGAVKGPQSLQKIIAQSISSSKSVPLKQVFYRTDFQLELLMVLLKSSWTPAGFQLESTLSASKGKCLNPNGCRMRR